MLYVKYSYFNKKENAWKDYEMSFYDKTKALRFCWSIRHKYNTFLIGIGADYGEEYEHNWLSYRINYTTINYDKI